MKTTFTTIRGRRYWLLFSFVSLLISSSTYGQGSGYKIQTGDHLQISFWESPELNSQAIVSGDGAIELPIIGKINAAGLTKGSLRDKIISEMALYSKLVTQITIAVLDYGGNRVYVTGQVRAPGRYSFEEIPNLWDILLEAGGHLATAFLDQVTVIRKRGNGEVFVVDVADALRNGKIDELPRIYPGDTIDVPGSTITGSGSLLTPSAMSGTNEYYVLGAVRLPGTHKFESGLDLLEAIGKAGGPTNDAKLKEVRYVSVVDNKVTTVTFNLEKYFKNGFPHPVTVKPNDQIFIPYRKPLSPIASIIINAALTTAITVAVANWVSN